MGAVVSRGDPGVPAGIVDRARRGAVALPIVWRWATLIAGLIMYGFAAVLMIRSNLGLGPWDAFHVGLSQVIGLSVGVSVILVGLVVVAGSLFIGVRPGPGTVANMVLIGVFVDLFLPLMPEAPSVWIGLPYHLAGTVLTGLATGLYIAPGLGKGPRDGMMIGISKRTGWSLRWVRTGTELTVLLLGWAMGAKLGLGTIIFALLIGRAMEWGLRVFSGAKAPGRRS